MTLAELIVQNLFSHFYFISFAVGLLGEEAILLLTFLASKSMLHVRIIFLLAPLGVLLIDIIYFHIGKLGITRRFSKKVESISREKGIVAWIIRFSGKQPFLALVLTKFVWGTRIALLAYYKARGMSYKKFFVYDIIAIEIWAAIMIPLAWFAGRGLTAGLHLVKDFGTFIGMALVLLFLWYLVSRLFSQFMAMRAKVRRN